MSKKQEATVIGVLVPHDLRKKIEKIAEQEDRSLSRTIVRILRQAIEASTTEAA